MSLNAYLEALPFHEIIRHQGGSPLNAIAYSGVPHKHPYDSNKVMLFCDPLGSDPQIMEFLTEDILQAEQLPSPVTDEGESLFLARLWVRKGASGMLYQPFEVDDPPRSMKESPELRDRFPSSISRSRK